jgi:hypothetical protein
MATLQANGGVVRRWVNRRTGFRLALCANGRFLIDGGAGKWRRWKERMTPDAVAADRQWEEVTTPRWPTRT